MNLFILNFPGLSIFKIYSCTFNSGPLIYRYGGPQEETTANHSISTGLFILSSISKMEPHKTHRFLQCISTVNHIYNYTCGRKVKSVTHLSRTILVSPLVVHLFRHQWSTGGPPEPCYLGNNM